MKDTQTRPENRKARLKTSVAHEGQSNTIILFYRWMLFIFSAVLSLNGARLEYTGYAILESLAVAAIYNGAVTVYCMHNGKKFTSTILFLDTFVLTMLMLFSGGLKSELYILLFFIIGLCGVSNEAGVTMKIGIAGGLLYSVMSVYAGKVFMDDINIVTLIIRDALLLLAAFAISRINCEVKMYDEMRKKEFRLARTDKLTGLANRHYFDQKLKDEVEYACAKSSVLNILIFDLDNFKKFNDTYGHVSGDKLLTLFSDIIRQCVRKTDIPIRYGGEEFMIIIRDLDIIIAKSVGERIRRQLEKQHIYLGPQEEKKRVTVSCGLAQYPTHSQNIKEVIECADQALYYAKDIGRNIVVTYDEIGSNRDTLEGYPIKL